MKLEEALRQIDELKPDVYSQEVKIRWLSELDGDVYRDIIKTHQGGEDVRWEPYTAQTPMDAELLIPDPDSVIYILWLESRIDFYNGEYGRYNNSNAAYAAAMEKYQNRYNREHMPIGQTIRYF